MLFHNQQPGNYSLLRLLGQSSSSHVYLAEHIHSHEQVAIKLLTGRRDKRDTEQFLAQATILTHLQHPHIVPVLDFGVEGGMAFLVMRYMPHGTVRQQYPKGARLPLELVVQYTTQVADALYYVHEHQLVHRDIKPHNMLLGANGEVLLSDFGIATLSESLAPTPPETHSFEGTVLYAAPEQLRGTSRRSSDQYALAVVVYEWICGDWPFSGSFEKVSRQHLYTPPPRFQEKGVVCSTSIEQVVLRALEKEPARRFATVKQFADELAWSYTIANVASAVPSTNTTQAGASTQQSVSSRPQFKSPLPFEP